MNKKYKGVIPPIITPVDAHERVDEAGALRALIRHCIEVGLHGIFVAGTNGEAMALCPRERERAIKITLDECGEKIPVLCGIMDSGTDVVIENLKRLEQLGGKAAVVTPVFYAKHAAQGEFLRHYEAVSRSASCDILIYNIPAYTGACMKAEDVFEISKMEHISGYKDSSGNLQEFISCTEHFRNTDFSVLQVFPALRLPVCCSARTAWFRRLHRRFRKSTLAYTKQGGAATQRRQAAGTAG